MLKVSSVIMGEIDNIRQLWPYALVAVGAILLLRVSMRRIKKGGISDSQARQKAVTSISKSDEKEIRTNLEKLLVNLQELARQINGHIDTRFCKLEVLIKQADERIRRLEELGGGKKASDEPVAQDEPVQKPEPVNPEHEVIYKLADTGKGAVEIAQAVNKPPGEVELILSLRRTGSGREKIDYRIE
jgi:hypothetical protein